MPIITIELDVSTALAKSYNKLEEWQLADLKRKMIGHLLYYHQGHEKVR